MEIVGTQSKIVKAVSAKTSAVATLPYDNVSVRHLTASEALYACFHWLIAELIRRLFVPYLRDRHGIPYGPVPDFILTLQHGGRAKGFAAEAVWSDAHGRRLDQVTLVLGEHVPRHPKDVAATACHEIGHVIQFHYGSPGPANYHNAEYRDLMRSIGIQTSKTGRPGGAQVGHGMRQYVIEGGPFDRVLDELITAGFEIPLEAARGFYRAYGPHSGSENGPEGSNLPVPKRKPDPSKTKFSCPTCGQIARAKASAKLLCGQPTCAAAPMPSHGEK